MILLLLLRARADRGQPEPESKSKSKITIKIGLGKGAGAREHPPMIPGLAYGRAWVFVVLWPGRSLALTSIDTACPWARVVVVV
jgi:hypothetical protein